ncbi:hypothetical protein ACQ4PT_041161 [Festuca glaucescens]
MPSVEDDLVDDLAGRFKMRFSVRRFEVAMRNLTPKQIGFLLKYGYDRILELKHKVVFPMVLIDWVMDNMVLELAMFHYEHKRIYFDKYMIQQFIGIPSGDTIAKMSSKNPVIVDKDHFMDQHEDIVVKSSHCNEHVIEQNKAPTDSNVTGDKRNCDASTSTPQEEFPSDLVMKTHNEPILDKDKSKSETSATIEIRDAKPVHSLDPEQTPSANLMIPKQDSVVSISSASDFSHPHYDESATSRDSVIKAKTLLDDASTGTPQEYFPSDLVIKTHNEPILDKDKSKSNASTSIEIRDAKPVHSLDPEQTPSANLIIPKQDSFVSILSAADFSHPHYDESATSRDSVIKAKTLLDDASASPIHAQFKDSGMSITDVVYISSQEQEVDHSVEHIAQRSKCIDAIGDVASTPPSSSPNDEAHSYTIKSAAKDCDETEVNRGIDVAMSYASEDPKSRFSNVHTPLCTSSAEVQSDDVLNTSPSTIDKRKRKKRNAKKPCHSEERLNLFIDHSAEIFMISIWEICCSKILRNQERQNLNGHTVTYERFYQYLKPRGEIANEVMDAFVQLFNERNDKMKDDKNSRRKISFSPFFTSKLNVPPEKFNAKSVSREIVKMNKKFNFAKCDLLHFPLVHDNHWTITCINLLFKKINFLISLQDKNKEKKAIMASNMVTNFHKPCTESKCFNFMLDNYVPEIPHNLPQQTTTFDCGVFSFLYMEHWEGQEFKMFEPALISKFRKVWHMDLFHRH